MGANGHINFQTRIQMIPQHLAHPAPCLEVARGVISNNRSNNLARASIALFPGGNEYLLIDAGVIGDDKANAALFLVTPHYAGAATTEHFYHLAFLPTASVNTGYRHQYFITVKNILHRCGVEQFNQF